MWQSLLDFLNSAAFTLWEHPTSYAELFGFITGLLAVGLVALNRISNFAWGMANAFFFLVLFFDAKLFADGVLQIMFFTLNALGWWAWLRAGPNRTALHVERANKKFWLIAMGGMALIYIIELPILHHVNDSYLYFDAFILAGSVAAQFLMSYKKLESWYLWIAVDIVSIPLYFVKGLTLTGIVYILFMTLCFVGLRKWYRIYKGEEVDEIVEAEPIPQVAIA